jgi:carbamoylphosphate synthase large subunit
VLADLPFETLTFVAPQKAQNDVGLADNVSVETVRWSDIESMRQRAIEKHREHGIFAVCTTDERLMELSVELREVLGAPGATKGEVARFRDKVEMKRCLEGSGVRTPRFAECTDRKDVESIFSDFGKIVIKPRDGFGSKNVAIIDDRSALDRWFSKERTPEEFEAEEFIEGDLYHVNAVVDGGEVKLNASAPYLPGMANIDFAEGTPFVTWMLTEGQLKERLDDVSQKVVQGLELDHGVTHLEVFVTPDDEIVFCEIGNRPGGGGIIWMIEAQYGINYVRAALMLEAGRGKELLADRSDRPGIVGLLGFRAGTSFGMVKRVPQIDAFRDDWILKVEVDLQEGSMILPSSHGTDYIGFVLLSARDQEDFNAKRIELHSRFYEPLVIEST